MFLFGLCIVVGIGMCEHMDMHGFVWFCVCVWGRLCVPGLCICGYTLGSACPGLGLSMASFVDRNGSM